jgi:hypothetical protein
LTKEEKSWAWLTEVWGNMQTSPESRAATPHAFLGDILEGRWRKEIVPVDRILSSAPGNSFCSEGEMAEREIKH